MIRPALCFNACKISCFINKSQQNPFTPTIKPSRLFRAQWRHATPRRRILQIHKARVNHSEARHERHERAKCIAGGKPVIRGHAVFSIISLIWWCFSFCGIYTSVQADLVRILNRKYIVV